MNAFKSSPDRLGKSNQSVFEINALEIFKDQASGNKTYHAYLQYLEVDPLKISSTKEIPFLPIEFFKYHPIKTNDWPEEIVFESSGTTGLQPSKHYVQSLEDYHLNAEQIFEEQFGEIKGKTIIGLLPSYLERSSSSLVSMVDHFIKLSGLNRSGFYLNDKKGLTELLKNPLENEEVYLFGVSFALLDLAEDAALDLSHITVIETGGMKGRRKEIVKEELYAILNDRLNLKKIYTEYGMTELLSQAYGRQGLMSLPKTMSVLIRDINDPFTYLSPGKTGGINIIDLANKHSCSFIETKDLGRINVDGSFEILGRFDNSDIRGCNLMVS